MGATADPEAGLHVGLGAEQTELSRPVERWKGIGLALASKPKARLSGRPLSSNKSRVIEQATEAGHRQTPLGEKEQVGGNRYRPPGEDAAGAGAWRKNGQAARPVCPACELQVKLDVRGDRRRAGKNLGCALMALRVHIPLGEARPQTER